MSIWMSLLTIPQEVWVANYSLIIGWTQEVGATEINFVDWKRIQK